jgi:hypothetical protein
MVAWLKRVLRPFRPVLRPIWRRIMPPRGWRVEGPLLRSRLAGNASDTIRTAVGRPRPIRPLRHHELDTLTRTIPYYRQRGEYLGVACRIASDMINRHHARTALELGPNLRSVIVGADTMEVEANAALQAEGRRFLHDATTTPWPVEDKAYDLFVALQVFEHLGTRQPEVFREVRRVARNAILSLPIDWVMADPADCHHQLSRERVLAWFAPVVPTRVVVGNGGAKKRLVYVFEDLSAPDAHPGMDPAVTLGMDRPTDAHEASGSAMR